MFDVDEEDCCGDVKSPECHGGTWCLVDDFGRDLGCLFSFMGWVIFCLCLVVAALTVAILILTGVI